LSNATYVFRLLLITSVWRGAIHLRILSTSISGWYVKRQQNGLTNVYQTGILAFCCQHSLAYVFSACCY